MLQNNRQLHISTAGSRHAVQWPTSTLWWSELIEKLAVPVRSTETMADYLALSKGQQDDLKDVGGFVGGELAGGRRKAANVTGRDLLTLDLDSIPARGTQDVLRRLESLGCCYAVYSTRKHRPDAPRLRVLWPTDVSVSADAYEPLLRKMAELAGLLAWCDPSTFQVHRLMYWPSCCADGEYLFHYADKQFLSSAGVLGTYADWRDIASWPQVPGLAPHARLAAKQGDPHLKSGPVGAFCRTYDIYTAMDKFLPGIYLPTDLLDRFTFTGGSTAGGAIVYDEGKFLFSHHATDPCSDKLVNSFDLVRLHRFGDLDDEAKPGTPVSRLPSYTEMCRLAVSDPEVSALLSQERYEQATKDFEIVVSSAEGDEDFDLDWMGKLEVHQRSGMPEKTIDNVWLILENDPRLKGKFAFNQFANRGEILGQLPWQDTEERRFWGDNDNFGLYWYIEKVYKISSRPCVDGALSLHSTKHAFNNVKDYLLGLSWDGTPRLDSLFIDYLGAEDNTYIRAVTRKALTAAVARVMEPGCKFDTMTILSGPQGIGKSSLLLKMSCGWFNDSIRTFEGKEASELLQGVWLVEISELDAFRRTDVSRIKQFLSLTADRFRAAYGRHVQEVPRTCVFFGTTNSSEYLQDKTGNRRFWPVDVGRHRRSKSVWRDLDGERDQLWAEAVVRWQLGESLYLSGEIEEFAKAAQEQHREAGAEEGPILEFLNQPIPHDWLKWDASRRAMFWGGTVAGEPPTLVQRDRVCAVEIWCEALGKDRRFIRNSDSAEINRLIEMTGEWEKMDQAGYFGPYSRQRGFIRSGSQGRSQSASQAQNDFVKARL